MKAGPIVAMVALVAVGMWLVLQPALARGNYDLQVRVGAEQLLVQLHHRVTADDMTPENNIRYEFLAPADLAALGEMNEREFSLVLDDRIGAWKTRPGFERALLGFFNITSWFNFGWVAIGLLGQAAFFGRMFIQWIVSEKSGESQVPVLFWWFSFIGGLFLFTYFVWRVDAVGVLGQSTGVVIYARNLRLIQKQKKRAQRESGRAERELAAGSPEPGEAPSPHEPT